MRKKGKTGVCKAAQLRDGSRHPFGMLGGVTALGGGELEVYRQIRNAVPILDAAIGKLVRLTGLEPTRRIDTSTSSWPVYQFQHSRKQIPPKKDCLIIIAIRIHNVNQNLRFF